MPNTCSICKLKNVGQINSQIARRVSFRDIARQVKPSKDSVYRHATNCLGVDVSAYAEQHTARQVIDVKHEFEQQLEFAKKLRLAAEEYLSDAADPLKLTLTPRADEITVTYYDHTELTEHGKPTKKSAQLSELLHVVGDIHKMIVGLAEGSETAESVTDQIFGRLLRVDKVSIKHVDLRSFALDAIRTTDIAIDKLAKMEGAYTDNKPNPKAAALKLLETVANEKRISKREAIEWLLKEQQERRQVLIPQPLLLDVARENGVIVEVEGLQ